jgi:hypothetical protein
MDEIEYDWAITLAQLWDDPNHDNFECEWDWKNAYEHRREETNNRRDNGNTGDPTKWDQGVAPKGSNRDDQSQT